MIAIFGGTFDPLHNGHLALAQEVRAYLGLDSLRMLPCGIPPHRRQPLASIEQRRCMLEKALEGEPGLVLDDRELLRPGPSYMVDTLASMRLEYPLNPLVLIIGSDALCSLHSWHNWQALFEYAHIIVLARPGYTKPKEDPLSSFLSKRWTTDSKALSNTPAGRIMLLNLGLLEVSSSQIREMIQQGHDVSALLPLPVYKFIRANSLYCEK